MSKSGNVLWDETGSPLRAHKPCPACKSASEVGSYYDHAWCCACGWKGLLPEMHAIRHECSRSTGYVVEIPRLEIVNPEKQARLSVWPVPPEGREREFMPFYGCTSCGEPLAWVEHDLFFSEKMRGECFLTVNLTLPQPAERVAFATLLKEKSDD